MNEELIGAQRSVFVDALFESPDLHLFLGRLVSIAAVELGQAEGDVAHCSITVLRHRRPSTFCSTDADAALMDELQYGAKEGPCLQALETGDPVEVPDLRTDRRWPSYREAVAGARMRSVFAIPLDLDAPAKAALNCYSPHPGPIPEDVARNLLAFALVAARALTLSVRLQMGTEKSEDLTAALQSRTTIDLAAGVIMAQSGCTQDEAMAMMIKASSHRNQKLRDVARSILARFNGTAPTTHFE